MIPEAYALPLIVVALLGLLVAVFAFAYARGVLDMLEKQSKLAPPKPSAPRPLGAFGSNKLPPRPGSPTPPRPGSAAPTRRPSAFGAPPLSPFSARSFFMGDDDDDEKEKRFTPPPGKRKRCKLDNDGEIKIW